MGDADTPIPELLAEVKRLNALIDAAQRQNWTTALLLRDKDEEIARLRAHAVRTHGEEFH